MVMRRHSILETSDIQREQLFPSISLGILLILKDIVHFSSWYSECTVKLEIDSLLNFKRDRYMVIERHGVRWKVSSIQKDDGSTVAFSGSHGQS
jgi:hypothetical protein